MSIMDLYIYIYWIRVKNQNFFIIYKKYQQNYFKILFFPMAAEFDFSRKINESVFSLICDVLDNFFFACPLRIESKCQ